VTIEKVKGHVDVVRTRPLPTRDEEGFWTSGADGRLRIQRCGACGNWQHPPNPVCYHCLSREVAYEEVCGRGVVHTYTVNHQPWLPHLSEPFAIVVVELDEQAGLRLFSRLVDTPLDVVEIGLRVRVVFEPLGDGMYVPLFTSAEVE
jgi:uncharacterized OB-fold protein